MPTLDIQARVETMQNQALATGRKSNKFTKPQMVETANWAVGDKFVIPSDYTVISQKIGTNTDEFIFVPVTEIGGNVEVKRLRPSLFSRRVLEINDDFEATNQIVRAGGAVVDLYKTGRDADAGMRAIAKKCADDNVQIEIKNIVPVQTFAFQKRDELQTINVATEIEFV